MSDDEAEMARLRKKRGFESMFKRGLMGTPEESHENTKHLKRDEENVDEEQKKPEQDH